jgi:transcriptional regulator with GAF, ATPase, and Fis domain
MRLAATPESRENARGNRQRTGGAENRRTRRDENIALREEFDHTLMVEEMVGSSQRLRKVLKAVDKVTGTDSTVLILGETRTGRS